MEKISTQSDALPPLEAGTFAFDLTPGPTRLPVALRWGTREHLNDRTGFTYVSARYAALRFCIAGAGTFESRDGAGRRWEVEPGMGFWNARGREITMSVPAGGSMVNYVVLLFGSSIDALVARHLPGPVGAAPLTDADQVRRVMEALLGEGMTAGEHREENAAALIRVLFRRFEAGIAGADPSTAVSRQTYERIRRYIREHAGDLTGLPDVAAACQVTVPYLCRVFERFDTTTPYDYLTSLKLARAERLLVDSRRTVAEVALAVGYKDAKLFSRNFKGAFGKSPREYRHSVRQDG